MVELKSTKIFFTPNLYFKRIKREVEKIYFYISKILIKKIKSH